MGLFDFFRRSSKPRTHSIQLYFYQSRPYVETDDIQDAFAGNAPIIFNRVSGEYRVTGTAHPLEQYLRDDEATLAGTLSLFSYCGRNHAWLSPLPSFL